MQRQTIRVSGISVQSNIEQLRETLANIDGVNSVSINIEDSIITLEFETPASLNNLEKAVYDLGYTVL
ncbi:heavy-metal-associated domain-containing protein [Staphylococcus gallinarum]|uniref:Heavy-metal-associated domain-containing protein n=1 Tax=Staphylococcus gallinarum TaxID=1293 RepID=A0A3A0VMD6_STAGA|nr:cation transporter [Staphylococcus gallinarum]RIP32932.1 heavy-metal-associated domain-containing protein [Staphylococcus gallinarum]